MADQPKAQGGGNLKYIVFGLLLLAGSVGLWFMLKSPPPPQVEDPAPKVKDAQRVNPMAQPELLLDEQKDAGQQVDAGAAEKPKHVHHDTRDTWDCQGDVTRAALQQLIDSNRTQIRNCYERRLKVNNVLQGDLKLKLKIGSTGQMVAAAVSGTLHDNDVFNCVRTIAQRWTLPPPSGGDCAVVQVPFQFSPKTN